MSFFSIYPRDNTYNEYTLDSHIPLRVVQDDGVEVSPDIKFNKVTLSGNVKIFRNQSGEQDSFSITVLMSTGDFVSVTSTKDKSKNNLRVIDVVDDCIRRAIPFMVVTDAEGVSNFDLWLVTEQKKRTQTHKAVVKQFKDLRGVTVREAFVEWDLTFTKYKYVTIGSFHTNSAGVDAALKAYEKKKKTTKKTTSKTKQKTNIKNKLYKCNYKVLVYSKKKKVVECVKTLQERLYLAGMFYGQKKADVCDGWFGQSTKKAVAKWQTKWGTKYGLRVDGYVDKATWLALCGRGKVPTVTTTVTKGVKFTNAKQTKQTVNLVGGVGSSTPETLTVSVKSVTTPQKIVNVSTVKTTKLVTPTVKKTTTTTKKGTKVTKTKGKSTKVTSKTGQKKTTKNKKK